jgi:hypothetical protein
VATSNNPLGRPIGSRNRRTVELWDRLEKRGDIDPADYLSSVVNNKRKPEEIRIQAAGLLLPYKYSKCGTTAQPLPLIYNTTPVELPHPGAVELRQVVENLEYLSALRRDGKLDLAAADSLISDMRLIRDTLIEEAKLLLAQGGSPDQRIVITGGLPNLPLGPGDRGIIMPDHNSANVLDGYEPLGPPASPSLPPIRPKGEG